MARKAKAAPKSRLDAEMRTLGRKMDGLIAAARKTEGRLRASSAVQLRKLKVKQAAAKRALAKLGRQSAAASGPVKSGLRKAWRDIEAAVRQATKRFRETG
ncbi:MAG TPA: hypothetical protein VML57_16705 [Burkholderiales bacterium]|jgi:hypothetical protein|nr:hypothetical protein [Burkholderiales bacterium]